MTVPRLTFFCELEANALQELFADSTVMTDLRELQAGVSLGILDLHPVRAAVVRCLNETGIPVVAWQLLPKEQGYWFNLRNAQQAVARYADFKAWATEHGLRWASMGLDIEPDMREVEQLTSQPRQLLPAVLRRAFDSEAPRRAESQYSLLVAQMHADGYAVESYVMPLIVDERQAGSTLLRRIAGLVDVPVDREVLMLYSSFSRPRGAGTLWSYAQHAQAVGVGSTGGGVSVGGADQVRPLDWGELGRDLLLARRWCQDIYIFSLEGCVRQGFLARLKSLDWDSPVPPPLDAANQVRQFRRVLRTALWLSAHPVAVLGALFVLARFTSRPRRKE